jgi:hypothetical protein
MKKTLIALAALGVVGAASAQNFSISGSVSMGYLAETNGAKTINGIDVYNSNSMALVATEDLGGGMTASAKLQWRLNNMAERADGDQYVDLAGPFGSLRLGQFTFASASGYNPFASTHASTGGGAAAIGGANTVAYTSPSFNGVTVAVGTTSDTKAGVGKPGMGVRVNYSGGPLSVQYASSTAPDNDSSNATNGYKFTSLGATYDLGMAKAYLTSYQETAGATASGTDNKQEKGVQVGAAIPMGALTFKISNMNRSSTDTTSTAVDTTSYGFSYALSKRTTAEFQVASNKKVTTAATKTQKSWIGISHSF